MPPRNDETEIWQLWKPFVGIHRWCFSRGCPPTLRRLRGWTRVVHASVLMSAWGLGTGLLCVLALGVGDEVSSGLSEWSILAVVGGFLGAVFLVPIARWSGRAWWYALIGIGWQAALLPFIANWSSNLYDFINQYGNVSLGERVGEAIVWGDINATLSLGMSLWMVDLRRLRTAWMLAWALPIGLLSMLLFYLIDRLEVFQGLSQLPLSSLWGIGFLLQNQAMYYPLQLLFLMQAIVLGTRFWTNVDAGHTEIPTAAEHLPSVISLEHTA